MHASASLPRIARFDEPLLDAAAAIGRELVADHVGPADAPPLLLLHGITGSRHYWDRTAARLAPRRRVVAPDLMGFGASPKPSLRYDLPAHVASLRSFLERHELDDRPIDVVAHSLGALITLSYAARHPGHVRSAVLVSVPCYADRAEAHELFLAGSANYRRLLGRASLASTLRSWLRAGPIMAARYAFAFSPRIASDSRSWTFHSLTSTLEHCLLGHRVQATMDELAALPPSGRPRLLLIHGERDQVAPVGRVRELGPRLGGAEVEVLRGTGHHPLRTHAAACLDRVERFLLAEPA